MKLSKSKEREVIKTIGPLLATLSKQSNFDELDNMYILNQWLRFVRKPSWMDDLIDEDLSFIVYIYNYINDQRDSAMLYESEDVGYTDLKEETRARDRVNIEGVINKSISASNLQSLL